MTIEDRNGTCRTCHGRVYRQPTRSADIPDRWFHRSPDDWKQNPHDVDPVPDVDNQEQDTTA